MDIEDVNHPEELQQFEINYELPEAEFHRHIDNFIQNTRKTESALILPVHIQENSMEVFALILGQLNCTNCDARCCRTTTYAEFGIPFLKTEYQTLVERIGDERLATIEVKTISNSKYFPVPCPFLRKKQCTIYDIRPIACVQYPINPPGEDSSGEQLFSLDPMCPEARRIVKSTYLALYKLVKKFEEIYPQRDEIKKASQIEQAIKSLDRKAKGN
jgi:Fe-S-cluster containining protein